MFSLIDRKEQFNLIILLEFCGVSYKGQPKWG